MPQFEQVSVFGSLIFWSVISFGILFFVLKKFAFPPILEALEMREKKIRDDIVSDMPSAVDILKVQLAKAMQIEDHETIERLALALAEFEQPKLQRIDQTNLSLDASELSEEELQKKIAELSAESD